MSSLNLSVGGRRYKVHCADGEEAHVTKMAGIVDARLTKLGATQPQNEAKNLLFAALVLADELHEANLSIPGSSKKPEGYAEKLARLQEEVRQEKKAREKLEKKLEDAETGSETLTFGVAANRALSEQERKLADQLETLAADLEQTAERLETNKTAVAS
ncbi:cell division protein ZapA [Qipengyuania atrilutea]|uniref:Cell division protein ZapA n=1 Tax=Qipengyuania atrilutea TaxID=2744473 RepID=A0A850H500_9SPHN|nr:cell division protein ZapA [Actirhodobacter atriluteus]NVD44195.1 cell division protein ZapA [Actirhodobacter atriluteus]